MIKSLKAGDLAVLAWPPPHPDDFQRIRLNNPRRSITLWDNPEMKYSNGRFPNRAIWGDQLLLVLQVMNVTVTGGSINRMARVFSPEGFGWVLESNLEVL